MTGEPQALLSGLWVCEVVGSIGRIPFAILRGQLPQGCAPRRQAWPPGGWAPCAVGGSWCSLSQARGCCCGALWFPSSAGSRQVPGLGAPVPRRWVRPIRPATLVVQTCGQQPPPRATVCFVASRHVQVCHPVAGLGVSRLLPVSQGQFEACPRSCSVKPRIWVCDSGPLSLASVHHLTLGSWHQVDASHWLAQAPEGLAWPRWKR